VHYELKFATLLRHARLAALACGKASLRAGHGRKVTFACASRLKPMVDQAQR
jgi:hypothetical protein